MVMQAADLRNFNRLPEARLLDRPGLWRILLKRQVGAIFLIIKEISPKAPQMRFSESNNVPWFQPSQIRSGLCEWRWSWHRQTTILLLVAWSTYLGYSNVKKLTPGAPLLFYQSRAA